MMRRIIAGYVFGKCQKVLIWGRKQLLDQPRKKLRVLHFQNQVFGILRGKGRQLRVKNPEASNRRPNVIVKGNPHGALVQDQRDSVVIDDDLRPQQLCDVFRVKLAAQVFLSL